MKDNKYGILSLIAAVLGVILLFAGIGIFLLIVSIILGIKSIKLEDSKAIPAIGMFISGGCILLIILVLILGLCFGKFSEKSENINNSEKDNVEFQSEDIELQVEDEAEGNVNENTEPESETKSVSEEPSQESEEEPPTPEPQESKEEFIASCEEIPYKKLLRNPDDYIGKRLVITAEIKQIIQGGLFDSNQYYRIQTDNEGRDWFLDDEYFMYDFRVDDDMKLLDEDVIKIYAEFGGMQEIKRALTKTKEEVPAIKAYYVELIAE